MPKSPRSPDRIDPIIERLRDYWHLHPNLRLGQLIFSLTPGQIIGGDKMVRQTNDPFYVEDEDWARELRNAMKARD